LRLAVDVFKLLIPVCVLAPFEGFLVGLQTIVQVMKQLGRFLETSLSMVWVVASENIGEADVGGAEKAAKRGRVIAACTKH
jgi:hypothetical protein